MMADVAVVLKTTILLLVTLSSQSELPNNF